MKTYQTIEPSGFRRGEYVGHCNGAQRIVRDGAGWRTAGLRSQAGAPVFLSASTLAELDAMLVNESRRIADKTTSVS